MFSLNDFKLIFNIIKTNVKKLIPVKKKKEIKVEYKQKEYTSKRNEDGSISKTIINTTDITPMSGTYWSIPPPSQTEPKQKPITTYFDVEAYLRKQYENRDIIKSANDILENL